MLPHWIYTLSPQQKLVFAVALLLTEMGGMALLEILIAKRDSDFKQLEALCELQLAGGIVTIPANYAALSLLAYVESQNVNPPSFCSEVIGKTIGTTVPVFGMLFQGALGKLLLSALNRALQWHTSYPSNQAVLAADLGGFLCVNVLLLMALMIERYCLEPRRTRTIGQADLAMAIVAEGYAVPPMASALSIGQADLEMAIVAEGHAVPPTTATPTIGSTSNPLHATPLGLITFGNTERSTRPTN